MWHVVLLGWDYSKGGTLSSKLRVWVTQETGGKSSADKVHGSYDTKAEADAVANQLRRQFGCS